MMRDMRGVKERGNELKNNVEMREKGSVLSINPTNSRRWRWPQAATEDVIKSKKLELWWPPP